MPAPEGRGTPISSDEERECAPWAQEHVEALAARELRMVDLLADWQEAHRALLGVYAEMYAAGMLRSEIAERLGLPIEHVPRRARTPSPRRVHSSPGKFEPLIDDDHTF